VVDISADARLAAQGIDGNVWGQGKAAGCVPPTALLRVARAIYVATNSQSAAKLLSKAEARRIAAVAIK
jgi:hypothetical protein